MLNSHFKKKKSFAFCKVFFIIFYLFFSEHLYANASENLIEYKIKAAYLYNFTKFIVWPSDGSETFDICIVGKDPFGGILDPIENRKVKQKPIRLYRLKTVDKAKHCHITYFSSLQFRQQLSKGLIVGSLTVGEFRKFVESGGMIAFFQKQGKIRLYINLKALRQSGLSVSAKLLEVAEIYEGEHDD